MAIPLAFEVFRNGKKLCTAGLRGKVGVLSTILTSVDGTGHDELQLSVGGLDSATGEHLTWVKRRVAIGDEIVVRVEENIQISRIRHRVRFDTKTNEQYEKAHLRKTAKKFGYKLVKA